MRTHRVGMNSAHAPAHKTSPLDTFTSEPTPAHAVELAIADATALRQVGVDWDFVAQLRKAQEHLAQREELIQIAAQFAHGCDRGESVGEAFFSQLLDRARKILTQT